MKPTKEIHGITLIALVITIIVLLILAGVVIATLTGENGIITKASDSKTESRASKVEDRVEMWKEANYADNWLDNDTEKDRETFIDELASEGLLIGDEAETAKTSPYTVTIGSKTINFSMDANNAGDGKQTISTSKDYSGYYADIDGDDTVDGIIYADLAQDGSGIFGTNGYGTYAWDAVSNLKQYYIKQTSYTDDFGTKAVLAPVDGTTGNDRFYVMALDDLTSSSYSTFYWYYNGYSNLSSSNNVSSSTNDFGQGKADTINVKSWNDSGTYGTADSRDLWQLWTASGSVTSANNNKIYTMVTSSIDSGKWFVPSKAEWATFGDYVFTEEGVTKSTYENFGLSYGYWSSVPCSVLSSYHIGFRAGRIYYADVNVGFCVRLSATF